MTTNRTVPERTRDWLQAFNVIRDELTPAAFRHMTALAVPEEGKPIDVPMVNLGMDIARVVFANDRAAAQAAAMITQAGVSRTPEEV